MKHSDTFRKIAQKMLLKGLKSCPKFDKSRDLVTLALIHFYICVPIRIQKHTISLSDCVNYTHLLSLSHIISTLTLSHVHNQCDRIGRFLKVLGTKFSFKVAKFLLTLELLSYKSLFK